MINEISISNCYGIDQLTAKLGSIVVIEGKNGAGKTSILASILKMLEGGHDPGILRRFCGQCNATAPEGDRCSCGGPIATAEKAKVEIKLDNGCRFLYSCTEKTYKLEGWNDTGAAIKAPKTALEAMISMDQVSPGELLKIDASTKPGMRDLRERLQRLIPLSFFSEDLPEGATDGEKQSVAIVLNAMIEVQKATSSRSLDLAGYDRAVSIVRETRQRINREQSEKAKTVAALQGKVDQTPEDVGLQLDAARLVLSDERTKWKVDVEQLEAEERASKLAEKRKLEASIAEIRARAEQEIAYVTAAAKERDVQITEQARKIVADMQPEHERKIAEYSADIARLEEQQRAYIESEQTRKHRDEFQADARRLGHESLRYDRALELMENLRIEKLRYLPIPGLEVGADYVQVDGVDWEKLNTAKRMWLCIRICAHLSKGEQKIIFLDHGEAFDSETFQEVRDACAAKGFQLILAKVTDAPKVRLA